MAEILPAAPYNFPMRKSLLLVAGLILFFFGAYSLPERGIPYLKKHEVNFGVVETSFGTRDKVAVHPLVSWLMVAGGVVLIGAGAYGKK